MLSYFTSLWISSLTAQPVSAHHGLKLVNYRGKCSWMVHHNRMYHALSEDRSGANPQNSTTGAAISDWNNYRVDWLAGPTVTQQCSERHVGDGMGFLSALRPRDRIAIWARAKVSGLTLNHASSARLIGVRLARALRGASRLQRLSSSFRREEIVFIWFEKMPS